MAFSVNHATIVGNVTQAPDLRYSPTGKVVITLNIATNHSIKKDNAWTDVPTYHRIVVWDKLAEWIAKTVFKGDRIYVDGRIDNRSYEKDGQKHYISEIIAERVIPMNKPKDTAGQNAKPAQPEKYASHNPVDPSIPEGSEEKVSPDDIPF